MELIIFFQIHLFVVDGEFASKCGQFENLAVTVKVETQCLRWNLCAADKLMVSNFLSIVPDQNFLFRLCFLQVPIDQLRRRLDAVHVVGRRKLCD